MNLPSLRTLILGAVLLTGAFFAGRAAWRALAGDEAAIRRLLADEAAAFNGASALSVLGSFAPDYREETLALSRDELRAGLLWSFLHRRDRASGRYLYRVELPEDVGVELRDGAATASFELTLYEGVAAAERSIWETRVEAELLRGEDGAWRIRRSRHDTIRGAPPRR
jgi:hypothetical protein